MSKVIAMSGNFSLKRPMRAGRMYSPGMVLAATCSSPARRPWKLSMAWSASRWSWSMRRACERRSCPARVTSAPRPSRSSKRTPSSCSRVRMCSEIVGWVSRSAWAALEKDLSSATFAKISSCLRSMLRSIGATPYGVYMGKEHRARPGPVRVSRRNPSVASATTATASAATGHASGGHGTARAQAEPAHHGESPHDARALAGGTLHGDPGATDIALELLLALVTAVLVDRHLGSSGRLLTAPLDVALHELLGVLLEDVVDLVQEVVEILLDLLSLLGDLGIGAATLVTFVGLGWPDFLLLLFSHDHSPPGPPVRGRRQSLDRREDDPLLALVLSLPVRIGRLAGLVRFEKEDLGDSLVGVDLGRQRRGVADLQRYVALPLRLEGRDVRDDAAASIGGLAHADGEHVARNLEVLDRSRQRKGVGRDDAHRPLVVHEGAGIEALGVDDGVVDVREDLEFVSDPEIVTIGGQPVGDSARADLALLERLDHALLEGHLPDPPITLDHMPTLAGIVSSPLGGSQVLELVYPSTGVWRSRFQVAPIVSTGSETARPLSPTASRAPSMARATASPRPSAPARSEGPAPESTQPKAPASSATRRTDSIHGKST